MAQSSEPASDEWFNQFARTALIYRIMDEALAGEGTEGQDSGDYFPRGPRGPEGGRYPDGMLHR